MPFCIIGCSVTLPWVQGGVSPAAVCKDSAQAPVLPERRKEDDLWQK